MTDTNTPPNICPDCGEVTNEVNVSVNVSLRDGDKDGVDYTGDTAYGEQLPPIGTVCVKCFKEWLDDDMIREALITLELITEEN